MLTLRERLLAAADRPREKVEVPEWAEALAGEVLHVTAMSSAERDVWEQELLEKKKAGGAAMVHGFRAALVALCTVDADGRRIFTDADVYALGQKADKPVDRLFDAACRLNGIGVKEAEKIEGN